MMKRDRAIVIELKYYLHLITCCSRRDNGFMIFSTDMLDVAPQHISALASYKHETSRNKIIKQLVN